MKKISLASYLKSFLVVLLLSTILALIASLMYSVIEDATAVMLNERETLVVTSVDPVQVVLYTHSGSTTTKLLKDGQIIAETHKSLAPRSYEGTVLLEPGEYTISGETVIVDAGKPNTVSLLSDGKKNYLPHLLLVFLAIFIFLINASNFEEAARQRKLQEKYSRSR